MGAAAGDDEAKGLLQFAVTLVAHGPSNGFARRDPRLKTDQTTSNTPWVDRMDLPE